MGLRARLLNVSFLLAAGFIWPVCASTFAQTPNAGGIQGVVSDASGKPVAKAMLIATNTDTGVQTSRQTNASGAYLIYPIQPGAYNVEVIASGFRRLLQEDIKVAGAQVIGLNLKLTPGAATVTVTITEPPLQLNSADLAAMGGGRIEGDLYNNPPPAAVPLLAQYNGATISPELLRSVLAQSSAAVPLFRDPIHDGAADPVVVWNRARKTWWMLYTNRRADLDDNSGVTWVHGTRIGIAESSDGGANWKYVSEADIPVAAPDYTLWAPEVIDVDGTYHMFLTVVPGTFTDWNHPRHIQHLTSKDLLHWTPLGDVNLPSDRTIDPCVFRLSSGEWRIWYKDEADHSNVHFSDSPDLIHWTPKGIATTNHGEGPVVFQWHGSYWLINDPHQGLAVFRSDPGPGALTTWHQQPDNLLREPGTQPTDHAVGSHADVVVDATGRAWLFYFTQQGGENASPNTKGYGRRSVLHGVQRHPHHRPQRPRHHPHAPPTEEQEERHRQPLVAFAVWDTSPGQWTNSLHGLNWFSVCLALAQVYTESRTTDGLSCSK
jgi:hypothetical protein